MNKIYLLVVVIVLYLYGCGEDEATIKARKALEESKRIAAVKVTTSLP